MISCACSGVPPKTMEHAAHAPGEFAHDGHGILPRIALVNNRVEAKFGGEFQLRAEEHGLAFFVGGDGLGIFRQAVVIETDFTQRNHSRAQR